MGNSPEGAVFGPMPISEYTAVRDADGNVLGVPIEDAWEYDDAMHYQPPVNHEGEVL